jgi:hypothetical protein
MRTLLLLALPATLTPGFAQSPTFAPPVRLQAGERPLGHQRLFPSPVLHDLDGDGRVDIVVGDLRGHLTVATRTSAAGTQFAAETKVNGADGKPLDFGNW